MSELLLSKLPFVFAFILSLITVFEDNDGNAVSLKRVSQIINKEVPFVFADCSNEKQLEVVFEKVWFTFNLINSYAVMKIISSKYVQQVIFRIYKYIAVIAVFYLFYSIRLMVWYTWLVGKQLVNQ